MASATNPKDSMKSTWRTGDREKWTHDHWLIEILNAHHVSLDVPIPVHSKTDKIPYVAQFPQHAWVLFYAMIPLLAHQAWLTFTGFQYMSAILVFGLYFAAFNLIIVRETHILRRLGHMYGFLDGDVHERDGVPDVGVHKVTVSLIKTTGARIAMAMYFSYNHSIQPIDALTSWSWWAWLSLEIGLYGIVLDFWFYWYHRAMHDITKLWAYHRTHHLTKHPNPMLTVYADHEQEFVDIVGIPFLTYMSLRAMGLPLGFYEWWICHQYIAFTEVWGHSGIRVHLTPPSTLNWFLQIFDAEIVVEDHDLHHRKGWRKSFNYGKQTRLWDRLFGTCTDRIESAEANVDYVNQATMPIL